MSQIFDTIICGAGPAGMSQFIYHDSKGELDGFLNRGICVLEQSDSLMSGSLEIYNISANSKGSALFEFLTNDSKIKGYLEERNLLNAIEEMFDIAPKLKDVAAVYKVIGDYLKLLLQYHDKSNVLTGAKVKQIEVLEDTLYKVIYTKNGQDYEVLGRNIYMNFGGKPKSINEKKLTNFTSAHDVISDNEPNIKEVFKKSSEIKIALIGNSHSAMSVLNKLNSEYSIFNSPKTKIDIYGVSPIKLYYASTEEANEEGYYYTKDDICYQTNRVNRYSGMREESFYIAKSLLNFDYKNINLINTYYDYSKEYDVVIECLGYESNSVPIIKNRVELEIEKKQGVLCTDEFFRPILKDGSPLKNCFSFGLGVGIPLSTESGGENSFNRNLDGVWLYQFFVAEKLLDHYFSTHGGI